MTGTWASIWTAVDIAGSSLHHSPVKSALLVIGFAAGLSVASVATRAEDQAAPGPASAALQARLMSGIAAGERLLSLQSLRLFYVERGQRLAWSDGSKLSPQVDVLLAALRTAYREGLRPAEYHLAAIDALLARLRPANQRASPAASFDTGSAGDLDLLLSDAFFLLATHLTVGRVNPESVVPEWNIAGRGRNLVFLLSTTLEHGHLAATLGALPPVREDYRLLRDALAAQRAIVATGGWPLVSGGPALREGDRSPRVETLRRRLAATFDLPSGGNVNGDLFDAPLAAALRHFQSRHGLDTDGIVGRRTLAALNVTALQWALQIEANLERQRWLPRELGSRHLLVNIADYSLALTEAGARTLEMRVIAGRLARQTPFFTGEITSIVFNPAWTVPQRIAVEDKLPLIRDDRGFLRDNGFKVFAPSGNEWREIDPAEIDWASLSATSFPYRLRQEPGPKNALGRIKFQIPNRHDVYLHDTPSHGLFARSGRSFSSGCIRVERAADLAERLLAADPAWTRARIVATIAAGATVSVRLPEPLPTYLLYWTAWVDRDGTLQLREDVYGRDTSLLKALAQPLKAY